MVGLMFAVMIVTAIIAVVVASGAAGGDPTDVVMWAMVPIGLMVLVIVLASLLFARRAFKSVNADLLRAATGGDAVPKGIQGTGEILSVQDTGVTFNNIVALFGLRLRVTIPDRAPYEATAQVRLGRAQWGQLAPGMTVGVRVDPADPSRVAVETAAPSAIPSPSAGGGMQAGRPDLANAPVRSAADILREGERGQAEIRGVNHTGMTAGQVAGRRAGGGTLSADEADDPLVHIVLHVTPRYGAGFDAQSVMRVPDGKSQHLSIGAKVPVAWMAGDTGTVVIDWDGLD